MENKKERLARIYNLARLHGLVETKKEFATALGLHPSTISQALNGDERYLSERTITLAEAYAVRHKLDEGNDAETEEPAPVPDIIIPAATADLYRNMSETIRIQAELIARMQQGMATGPMPYTQKNYRIDGK